MGLRARFETPEVPDFYGQIYQQWSRDRRIKFLLRNFRTKSYPNGCCAICNAGRAFVAAALYLQLNQNDQHGHLT